MPRPKVPLENRKRAVQACVHCRSSKKRCNGQHPCINCIRKGVGQSCTFDDTSTPAPVQSATSGGHRRSQNESHTNNQRIPAARSASNAAGSHVQSPATTIGTLASSPEASHRTQPRLLENTHGEKVFFGGSASIAFLQLIRDIVSHSLGKSDFTQSAAQTRMLEEPHADALPVSSLQLSIEHEHEFLDLYFLVAHGLLDISTKEHALTILNKHREQASPPKQLEIAIAQVIVAVGAQCSTRDQTNLMISRSYFGEAQKTAFAGMIEDPSLEMVELFLLMAFYMFGACHRNAAFMYIGVAARAAYVLGIHHVNSSNKQSTDDHRQIRARKTWKSLVTLDTITSSILGRPSATSTNHVAAMSETAYSKNDLSDVSPAMQADYELACLLDQKVQELYNSEKVTAEGARACLDQLSSWSAKLPTEVKLPSNTIQRAETQEQVVGGLHVSCFYYFAVMLVSRPFLIVCLTNRLAKSRRTSTFVSTDAEETNIEAEMQEIASACLSAATLMIQTCIETQTHGFLPENMRILKAWAFAAGLVLGFELFTVNQPDIETEETFRASINIMKFLSTHSSQAAHYHDILSSLSNAIAARRRKALAEKKRGDKPIVERIMAFQPLRNTNTDNSAATNDSAQYTTTIPALSNAHSDETPMPDFNFDFDFQDMMNEPFLNWENTDFLSWDPFSRDLLA